MQKFHPAPFDHYQNVESRNLQLGLNSRQKVRGKKCNSKCKILENLKRILPKVKTNISLKNYTTFKIGGRTKYFFQAKTKEDLIKAVKAALATDLPFFILGGGSNVLVSDKEYKGLVIKCQMPAPRHPNKARIGAGSNVKCQTCELGVEIISEAGAMLKDLVLESAELGFTGLEWAAGIPGTVGGAIRGNAGAFGESIVDSVKSVEVLEIKNKKTRIKNFSKKDCRFGYRDSIFKQKRNLIILSAVLEFEKGIKTKIKNKIKENLNYRQQRHPLDFPSAGSVFINLPEIPAAELIDKCGLKGRRIGNTQVSEKHCNFIINLGGAKAKDVKKLINLIKQEVKKKFKIELEEEINYFNFYPVRKSHFLPRDEFR